MHYVFLLIAFFALPRSVFAVLPPDILFSVGTQLWQIVAGVGALIVGSLAALFPFLRNVSWPNLPRRSVFISAGVFIVLLSVGYLTYTLSLHKESDAPPLLGIVGTTTGYEFHANKFVLLGETARGERVLVDLDMNRKELSGGECIHYYFANVIVGTTTKSVYAEETLPMPLLSERFFFSEFLRTLPPDHSAREQYAFTFTLDGRVYKVNTEMLTADFLLKNEPEYTAYVGVGKAEGSIDGEPVDFRVMSERIYSNDYRVSVFFDPEGNLKSESVQLVLWDEKGDFYMIDRSHVEENFPAYASHIWGLTKNSTGEMERYFEGDATMVNEEERRLFHATLGAKDSSRKFELSLEEEFGNSYSEGLVRGTVQVGSTGGEVRSVSGLGTHRIYGKE